MSICIILLNKITKVIFNTAHFQWRQKFTIRQNRKIVAVTRDACKFFNIAVPWCNVFITYRPIDCKTITCGTFKIICTPSLYLTCPHERFTTGLISPDPIKWLLLYVRMLSIFHKEMHGVFSKCIAFTDDRICIFYFLRKFISMWKLPRHFIGSRIIFKVLDFFTSFQNKCLETFFCKLFCSPATAESGSYYDNVECI